MDGFSPKRKNKRRLLAIIKPDGEVNQNPESRRVTSLTSQIGVAWGRWGVGGKGGNWEMISDLDRQPRRGTSRRNKDPGNRGGLRVQSEKVC